VAKPKHKLAPREIVQVIASLRYWGRAAEMSLVHPAEHPMVKARFAKARVLPLTLDELETLIGRLDGSWVERGLRRWAPDKYL
jgi:hypothetical protein